jgi:hypothetical protein
MEELGLHTMDTYPTDDAKFWHYLSNWHGAWGTYLRITLSNQS